jgi:hypothetical protein
MPLNVAVANDHKLFITYNYGRVSLAEVWVAADRVAALATGSGTYRGLAIFERDVDLSEWDGVALRDMLQRAAAIYRRLGLQRGESAAVVNFVPEAQNVMRLWNALGAFNRDIDMAFNIFWDVKPALRFLGVPPDVLARVYAQAIPGDR